MTRYRLGGALAGAAIGMVLSFVVGVGRALVAGDWQRAAIEIALFVAVPGVIGWWASHWK